MADGERLEGSANLTELDDAMGFAIGTFDMIGVNRAVKDGFSA